MTEEPEIISDELFTRLNAPLPNWYSATKEVRMTSNSNAIVKSSKAVKGSTSAVRSHLDAVERARELYLATIKRAEADYFDRIKRATDIIAGETTDVPVTMTEPAPAPSSDPQ